MPLLNLYYFPSYKIIEEKWKTNHFHPLYSTITHFVDKLLPFEPKMRLYEMLIGGVQGMYKVFIEVLIY